MKVLQINSVCGYGSTGRIAADLARTLSANGDECLIAYGRGQAPEDLKSIRIGKELDVSLHGVSSRMTDRHGFYSRRATQRFLKTAEEYRPDLIHLHNLHGYYLHLPTLFEWLRASGKPVVWTLHDCWAFTGHCAYFDYAGCDRWKEKCFDCPQRKEYPASLLSDASTWNYEQKKALFSSLPDLTLVTPSEWLAGLVRQSFLQSYPVQTIHNGIDTAVFQPTPSDFRKRHGLQGHSIILGVASVWEPRKGLSFLEELSKRMDPSRFAVVVVGVSEKQKKGLPAHMLGLTRTDSVRELAEIYTAADVFVNPTLEDNYPTTNLEALACGTPVITFDTGGCRESVSADCGVVLKRKTADELDCSVKRLAAEPEAFSRAHIRRQSQAFDLRVSNEAYLRLYEAAAGVQR